MRVVPDAEFQKIAEVSTVDRINIRATFSKLDRAKYISHLDLNRTMQRALKRAGIPVWYTEGFNPHAYIMFPLALSLGVESKCEIMDIGITEEISFDEIKKQLNDVLPEGLKIYNVALQEKKHTEIAFSEYKISLCSEYNGTEFSDKLDDFLNLEKIEIEKKTKKKGISLIDIKPYINLISKNIIGDTLTIELRLPAGTQTNINPSLMLDAFEAYIEKPFEIKSIERSKILCADGQLFS